MEYIWSAPDHCHHHIPTSTSRSVQTLYIQSSRREILVSTSTITWRWRFKSTVSFHRVLVHCDRYGPSSGPCHRMQWTLSCTLGWTTATLYSRIFQLHRLQSVLNAVVRLISNSSRCCHVRPLHRDRHWLPIRHRMQYKLCMLVNRCLYGDMPSHLSELAIPTAITSNRAGQWSCCPSLSHTLTRHSVTARSPMPCLELITTSHHTLDIIPPLTSSQSTWNPSSLHVHSNCHVFACVFVFYVSIFLFGTLAVCLIYNALILTWLDWSIYIHQVCFAVCIYISVSLSIYMFAYLHAYVHAVFHYCLWTQCLKNG